MSGFANEITGFTSIKTPLVVASLRSFLFSFPVLVYSSTITWQWVATQIHSPNFIPCSLKVDKSNFSNLCAPEKVVDVFKALNILCEVWGTEPCSEMLRSFSDFKRTGAVENCYWLFNYCFFPKLPTSQILTFFNVILADDWKQKNRELPFFPYGGASLSHYIIRQKLGSIIRCPIRKTMA